MKDYWVITYFQPVSDYDECADTSTMLIEIDNGKNYTYETIATLVKPIIPSNAAIVGINYLDDALFYKTSEAG